MNHNLFIILILSLLAGGCSNSEDPLATTSETTPITKEAIQKDAAVINTEKSLASSLLSIAQNTQSNSSFVPAAIDHLVPKLVHAYVPEAYVDDVLQSETLQTSTLASNEPLRRYLVAFYDEAHAIQQADATTLFASSAPTLNDIFSQIISAISEYIYSLIYNYFFPDEAAQDGEDEGSFFDDLIDLIFSDGSTGNNDDNSDGNSTSGDSDGSGSLDDTNQSDLQSEALGFTSALLNNATFYVVSSKADMTVTLNDDASQGSGSMGFISMGFDAAIDTPSNDLAIATSLMGDWIIKMTYLDSDYCIAADAINSDGDVYASYWFLDESIMQQAKTLAQARTLCLRYGYANGEVPDESPDIDESDLVAIDDIRDGFENVDANRTKARVEGFLQNSTHNANVTDATYYARALRHGLLSTLTMNNRPDTAESYENEIFSRELMPLAGSAVLQMQDLIANAMQSAKTFSTHAQEDFNGSISHFTSRIEAIVPTMEEAMSRMMDSDDYGASVVNSYGDRVIMYADNIDIDICFFFCNSSAQADVHLIITNDGTTGNYADIHLATRIYAEEMSINAVQFNRIVNVNAANRFASDGYELTFDQFIFDRTNSQLYITGSGEFNERGGAAPQSVATLNAFELFMQLQRQSADVTDYALKSASLSFEGAMQSKLGRSFEGSLYFDAQDSSANKMEGTLTGIDGEPTVSGTLKTTLTYQDIKETLYGREPISVARGLPYFIDADNNIELVASFYKIGTSIQAVSFNNDYYDCTQDSAESFSCSPRSYAQTAKRIRFTRDGEILTINTNRGLWYVTDITNISSIANSTMQLLHTTEATRASLDSFNINQAAISETSLITHTFDEEVTLNSIGNHSYSANLNITRGNESFKAYVQTDRDVENDRWSYLVNDLDLQNDYGTMQIQSLFVKEQGNIQFESLMTDIITDNILGEYELSMDDLFGLSYNNFKDIDELNIDALNMELTTPSDTAIITINHHLTHTDNTIVGESNISYVYEQSALHTDAAFDIDVLQDGNMTTFIPFVNATGSIKSPMLADDYTFALQKEDTVHYLMLTNMRTNYMQAFKADPTTAQSSDSYGVKATMQFNEDAMMLNTLTLQNSSHTELGTYLRENNARLINFSDGSSEYLYVH